MQALCCIIYPPGAGPGGGGGSDSFYCTDNAADCQSDAGGFVGLSSCTGSVNCPDPNNSLCCGVGPDSNGNYSNMCASDCSGGVQLCQSSSECMNGTTCQPLFTGATTMACM